MEPAMDATPDNQLNEVSCSNIPSTDPMASTSDGVSTYSSLPKTKAPVDGSLYTAGQGLVSVVNNPGTLQPSTVSSYTGLNQLWCWPTVTGSGEGSRWLEAPPAVAPGVLKDVTRVDFSDYLSRVSDLHGQFSQARRKQREDCARRRSVGNTDESSGIRGEGLVQALQKVPGLYFEEDFSLGRPETFHEVVKCDNEEEKSATLEVQNGYLMHDTGVLAQDTVETELLNEIAARSDSFFEAAESLQSLRLSMADTLEEIRALRHGMNIVKVGLCDRARKVQQLSRRRENLRATSTTVQLVEEIVHAQEALQLLILGRDYASALNLLDDLQSQCHEEELSRLHCLRHLPDSLSGSVDSITEAIVLDFLELLRWKQSSAVVHTNVIPVLQWCGVPDASSEIDSSDHMVNTELKDSCLSLLQGLSRTGALPGVLTQMSSRAAEQLKVALRALMEQLLPPLLTSSVPDESSHKQLLSESLGEQLKALKPAEFLQLMGACLSVGQACCDHYDSACEIVVKTATEGKVTGYKSAIEQMGPELLQSVVDTMHSRWTKILVARSLVQQTMGDLLELVDLSQTCIDVATRYKVRPLPKLTSVLQGQCKAHLELLHTKNVSNLQQALDEESWVMEDVGEDCQAVVDRLLSHQGATCSNNGGLSHEPQRSGKLGGSDSSQAKNTLQVGQSTFRIVAVARAVLLMLNDYIIFQSTLPDFATETGRRIVEVLTIFNSRSCQMVLGAQAMKQSGLKSITAKHLALCSQCVLLFSHLHAPIREFLLKEQGQASRVILEPELDRLKQDLQVHLEGIHSKLVSIMRERLLVSTVQLSSESQNWAHQTQETIVPSQVVEQIGKQLHILSRVLTPLLLESQIREIFANVAKTFSDILGPVFEELSPHPEWEQVLVDRWHEQWRVDCEFLISTLEGLPGGREDNEILLKSLKKALNAGSLQTQGQEVE